MQILHKPGNVSVKSCHAALGWTLGAALATALFKVTMAILGIRNYMRGEYVFSTSPRARHGTFMLASFVLTMFLQQV